MDETRAPPPLLKLEQLQKIVIFTPATGFFEETHALEAVLLPMQIWAGSVDAITPPSQVEKWARRLPRPELVEFKVVEGAGHFSFMNTLPPHIDDPMPNREEFLATLASDVCQFIQKACHP